MNMMDSLLLTQEEAEAFSRLSADLREGWTVEPESGTAFEHPKQIQMRMHMSSLKKYPFFRSFAEKLDAQDTADMYAMIGDIPEECYAEMFFVIGARGLTYMMRSLLTSATTDDELKAIAAWSQIRHDILSANATIPA